MRVVILLLTFLFIFCNCFSQEKYVSHLSSFLVSGTSTLHEWEMKSDKGEFEGIFSMKNNKLISVQALSFRVPAQSLKSGHVIMDDNTYKALKIKTYADINFVLSSANVACIAEDSYQLNCVGRLTIAGITHETDLLVLCKWNPVENNFYCTGIKKIKMTDYNIKPPIIMFGMIKTGDEISISYHLTIQKREKQDADFSTNAFVIPAH
jgi:YceI-like domain